ncbi:MAG: hypothetical protein U0X91_29840 [Spirosomataceae bacterium]
MSKPRQSLFFIGIAIVAMYGFSLFIEAEAPPCEVQKLYTTSEIVGKVNRKYIKQALKSFRKDSLVVLENGTTVPGNGLSFYKEFYETVAINDSVVKKKDTDTLFVYRNNTLLKACLPAFDCP